MAYEWKGQRYDVEWKPIGDMGVQLGGIDHQAEAEYWAANGGRPQAQAPSSPAPQPQAAAPSPQQTQLTTNVQNAINKTLESPLGVNEDDPTFKAQDQANKIQSQRAAERARMSTVQRMHAQGFGDSGAEDGAISRLEQQRGETDQKLNASLRMNFLEEERQKYSQALQLGAGIMTSQQEMALRERLAAIQAQLAREDLEFRKNYAYDSLGQQFGLSLAQMQQNAMGSFFGF